MTHVCNVVEFELGHTDTLVAVTMIKVTDVPTTSQTNVLNMRNTQPLS